MINKPKKNQTRKKNQESDSQTNFPEIDIHIPTRDDGLNQLLAVDAKDSDKAGILVEKVQYELDKDKKIIDKRPKNLIEPPVIIIEGETATGKTTLALQIAHAAYYDVSVIIKDNTVDQEIKALLENKRKELKNKKRYVFFYNIEQTTKSLINLTKNFQLQATKMDQSGGTVQKKFDDSIYFNLSNPDIYDNHTQIPHEHNKFYFCQFSPRPITAGDDKSIFEQRISELRNVLSEIDKKRKENPFNVLFVIDSLSAFAGRSLMRDDLYRLFTLFKNRNIPVILTLERHENTTDPHSTNFYEYARFLADIVIRLTRGEQLGHLQFYLEVLKSRSCRQVLGKHLYKIRTQSNAQYIGSDGGSIRTGIVVYPSIHFILSEVRQTSKGDSKPEYCFEDDYGIKNNEKIYKDLSLILNTEKIETNSSISIIGPFGTHKLALGMNLAMGHLSDIKTKERNQRILIINFGGRSDFRFNGIAWTRYNHEYSKSESYDERNTNISKVKFWHKGYKLSKSDKVDPRVVMTTLKVGQLTPEECFYVIENKLSEFKKLNKSFTSVPLSNIAEMCTGFPLLAKDPLFLPCLIDLFEAYNLVSISIGVEEDTGITNKNANFSLFARADYRIKLSHYPDIYRLSEKIITKKKSSKDDIKQQYISLIIDNVSGKHYARTPIWIDVKQGKPKRLVLSKKPLKKK